MRHPLLFLVLLCIGLGRSSAATYDIGPGLALTRLRDAPWATLKPGDVVNIHTNPGGYHEKIQISESGTAAQHIVIHGVPDPVTGALPLLDGKDAVEDPSIDWRNAVFSPLGLIVVSPRLAAYAGKYGTYHTSFVDIENLALQNALYTSDGSISYTDQHGVVRPYDGFACGIYIEWAHDFAIRGCEISYCCNGIFANSKNLAAQSSARLMIEHNYFHDNSLPYTVDPVNPPHLISNGYHEHHCYIESAGVTYQYNRFGPLRAGCHGVAIKDRSSGQIVRYNEFDMYEESNVMALIDPQGGAGWIDAQPDYKDSYVYGNLITIESYTSPISAFWWGAYNGVSQYVTEKRGVLHFYQNTVVIHHTAVALFFLPSTTYTGTATVNESVDCRNNVFFADSSVQSSVYTGMVFSTGGPTNGGGNITLGANWISPGWHKDTPGHAYEGLLNGTASLLVGDSTGANNPRFVDVTSRDYHVLTGSNIIDASGTPGTGDPAVTEEYIAPQSSTPRNVIGAALDLGAVESSGTPPPPPVGGALAFSSITYSVAENAGSASISVTRSGGATGSVSVVAYAYPGTASSPADFTTTVATLTWADGDAAPKSFNVPIVNDSVTELTETVNLTLSSVTGGAALGAGSQATLTINDDDTPPSQPIIAITGSGALIRFTSGAPGTLISNVNVTGINSPETMRGLAFRRSTGQLYVMGAVSGNGSVAATLYLLNPATGVLTQIASTTLAHPSFDLGFDPVNDQLRLFGSTGQNIRINPDTGAVIATDTAFAFAAGDVHAGATPGIVGADYSPGLTPTVYAIDKTLDILVRVGSPGGSPLGAASGQLTTIGALGKDTEGLTGLDFTPGGTAFAVLNSASDTTSNLYTIDTSSGHATSLGTVGVADLVRDIVVATPGQLGLVNNNVSVTEGDGTVALGVARTGGSWGVVTVAYATSDGTATAGSDYTAASGILTWQDGEVGVKTVNIAIANDNVVDGPETLGFTLSNVTGGALLLAPAVATVTISDPPYHQWKKTNFSANANNPLIAGDNATPGTDGVPNLLKYALGLNPNAHATHAPLLADWSGGAVRLTFLRDPSATDVSLLVEVSTDLVTWQPGSRYSHSLGDISSNAWTTQTTRLLDDSTGLETITVQSNLTPANSPKSFIRLKASQP